MSIGDLALGVVAAVIVVLTLSTGALGAYNWGQMFRNRRPNKSFLTVLWPTNSRLTDRGRYHRNRGLRFLACATTIVFALVVLGMLIETPAAHR
jgi:uncharacterized membrane protein YidH (DUF202 family)